MSTPKNKRKKSTLSDEVFKIRKDFEGVQENCGQVIRDLARPLTNYTETVKSVHAARGEEGVKQLEPLAKTLRDDVERHAKEYHSVKTSYEKSLTKPVRNENELNAHSQKLMTLGHRMMNIAADSTTTIKLVHDIETLTKPEAAKDE